MAKKFIWVFCTIFWKNSNEIFSNPIHTNILLFSHSVISNPLRPHACQASLPFIISQSLCKVMSIESVMPSNHFVLCCPLILLPSNFPSIRVFANKWPKHWSFSFNLSPSNEYSRFIFFRIDWFDLLAVQRTLKSLLQHHSSKASVIGPQPSLWSNSQINTWLLEKLQCRL